MFVFTSQEDCNENLLDRSLNSNDTDNPKHSMGGIPELQKPLENLSTTGSLECRNKTYEKFKECYDSQQRQTVSDRSHDRCKLGP